MSSATGTGTGTGTGTVPPSSDPSPTSSALIFSDWITRFCLVMIGGGLGSVLRYGVAEAMTAANAVLSTAGHPFPLPTLCVNLVGAFLIGCLYQVYLMESTPLIIKLFTMTGCLGGLTTFSSFALDTIVMLRRSDHNRLLAILYFLLTNVCGLILCYVGIILVEHIHTPTSTPALVMPTTIATPAVPTGIPSIAVLQSDEALIELSTHDDVNVIWHEMEQEQDHDEEKIG